MIRFLLTSFLCLHGFALWADQTGVLLDGDLPVADVVILGEVHDNPQHHANQAALVAKIQPTALVFEMLTPAQSGLITPKLRGDQAALEKVLNWANSGWPDFAMYYQIMEAAPKAAIFGANLPRGEVRKAVSEGAAAVFGDEAGTYGLEIPLPPEEQTARQDFQMAAHCDALPEELLSGMVEAQRLRDATIAKETIWAFILTNGPVVVITGNGHARINWGVPPSIHRAAPRLSVISLGQFEVNVDENTLVDYYLLTEAHERDDPCAVFRKSD